MLITTVSASARVVGISSEVVKSSVVSCAEEHGGVDIWPGSGAGQDPVGVSAKALIASTDIKQNVTTSLFGLRMFSPFDWLFRVLENY